MPAVGSDWSAAITNFNGEALVCETIASIKHLEPPPSEILLVDDGSTDASLARVRDEHPDVRIVSLGRNTGVLNIVRNRALHEARHRYVLIADNDVTFAPDAVRHLIRALQGREDAAACTPLIVAADDRRTLLAQGHRMHFLGWSTVPRAATVDGARELGEHKAVGCGIQLIDKARSAPVGFFDEDLVLGWGDDGEFHLRLKLAGLGCYTVPSAIVFHRRVREQSRFYGQLHNRWLILLKDYQWRTLLMIAPALLIYELLLVVLLVAMGTGREYGRALRDVAGDFPRIVRQRRRVQTMRRVADGEILSADGLAAPRRLWERKIVRVGLNVLSAGFRLYWALVRPLLRWRRSALISGRPGTGVAARPTNQ
jgi:GT2 family glycosyltransferase